MPTPKPILAAPVLLALAACGGPADHLPAPPSDGASITVQIRRDALGGGANLPVPPTTTVMNGASVAIRGTLVERAGEWIVVDAEGMRHWIHVDSVLLISARSDG